MDQRQDQVEDEQVKEEAATLQDIVLSPEVRPKQGNQMDMRRLLNVFVKHQQSVKQGGHAPND